MTQVPDPDQAKLMRTNHKARSRALWAFIVGGIGLLAALIGFVQYLILGEVFIRPDHDPLKGATALESLAFLSLSSVCCIGYGLFLQRRGKRHGAT